MVGEGVQDIKRKSVSVFCCYLLIAALFIWGNSFVRGEEGEPEIIDLDGPDGDLFKNDFASLLSDPYGSEDFGNFKLTFNGDGIFTFDEGILDGTSIHTDTLDQLRDDESFDLVNSDTWKDGVLTLENEGGVKMAIFLGNGEESAPDNIQSVEINKHTSIDYTVITDDGEANIHVSNLRGLYHLKDGDGDEILIEGLPKEAKIVDISEGGRVTIGSWGDGIDYRGPETTVEYDGIELRQAIYEPDDSIQSYHNSGSLSLDNFGNPRITNSIVTIDEEKVLTLYYSELIDNNKGITLSIPSQDYSFPGLSYGYTPSELSGPHHSLDADQTVYWDGDTLKGDISGFNEGTATLTNNGDNPIQTEIVQKGGDSFSGSVSKGEGLEIKDGVIHGTLGVSSRTKSSTDNQNQQGQNDGPSLPTPQNQVGNPDPNNNNNNNNGNNNNGNTNGNNNNGFSPGNTGEGLPPGNTGGGGGGGGGLGGALSKMLPFLLIGGGILAAMFLFGGEDEEEEEEDNRRGSKESGNETDTEGGEGNGDVNTGRSTGDTGSSDDTSDSSESSSDESGEANVCDCNENGCFNCPGDDCSQCIA